MIRLIFLLVAMTAVPGLAFAQQSPADLLNLPVDGSAAAWIIRTFGLLTVLSIAPGILIMVTSFPRFLIAFSILRSGMGLATAPSNLVLISLALLYWARRAPERATRPLAIIRARTLARSVLMPWARAMAGLEPVARREQPSSVPKNQYSAAMVMMIMMPTTKMGFWGPSTFTLREEISRS